MLHFVKIKYDTKGWYTVITMSLTYMHLSVSNPKNGKKAVQKRMLVDSGATYSVLPKEDLEKLNIKPDTTQTFVLANGQEIKKPVGEARFSWKDTERTAPVVFGDKGVSVLGATTLEAMGLILDPLNRRLMKLPMIL